MKRRPRKLPAASSRSSNICPKPRPPRNCAPEPFEISPRHDLNSARQGKTDQRHGLGIKTPRQSGLSLFGALVRRCECRFDNTPSVARKKGRRYNPTPLRHAVKPCTVWFRDDQVVLRLRLPLSPHAQSSKAGNTTDQKREADRNRHSCRPDHVHIFEIRAIVSLPKICGVRHLVKREGSVSISKNIPISSSKSVAVRKNKCSVSGCIIGGHQRAPRGGTIVA